MTTAKPTESQDIPAMMREIGARAKAAAAVLAQTPGAAKNAALTGAAAALRAAVSKIITANNRDLAAAKQSGLTNAMIDRLALDEDRVLGIARSLDEIAALADPVGAIMAEWDRPNGLHIERVRVPLGVIGIIYESRPNVTADAGALCLKSGNAVILRGGSDSFHSSAAIHACMIAGLGEAGLPEAAIQMVPVTDRAAVGEMLGMNEFIDVIIPRGGKSLVARVQAEAKVPVFSHLEGICHTYIDAAADLEMARAITVNAKMRRTGVCGATETLLIDESAAAAILPAIIEDLIAADCELRGDARTVELDPRVKPAKAEDWDTEYLDAVISVRHVDGVEGAIEHINAHGSEHTDCIVTGDQRAADTFLAGVNSAIALHNASTQFADGGEFGMGAEIGISTGRLHARGPIGVEQLTTFKYIVRGSGQVRP